MSPPSPPEVQVVTGSLRKAAGIWDQQARAAGGLAAKAESMRLGRIDAGVFQLIVGPYDEVADEVAGRCAEGQRRMSQIAGALVGSAKAYAATEQANAHAAGRVH